ncbi:MULTISPECIES: MarR family winged helix-turn-helix transcriptional regulator [Brevibacillus]|uniref:MarR family winged helix-turn-helix transcriptional regulator n=1 Tax=Brevibacillus TaxID=55080 RepID=UPI00156BA763|nr:MULTISPECIES: MarR family transcriptional regulator [Brevibacillus]NRR01220.1 MarR family transcriptional regulator [Brevibacillus sp. RS1.1]UIO40545.1 MarR family transcriptional regulator [Brevibacillus brevis]WJQ79495.1 MarR family transcriptional regulator [Brevibacillus brevis]
MSNLSRASKLEELDRVFVEIARFFINNWLEEESISPKQFILLRVLHQKGRSTVSELATILKLSNSATTIALNRLVKAGFIDRVRDEQDRRVVWVTLSQQAVPTLEGLLCHRRALVGKLLENLTDDELEQFTYFLRKMQQCI